MPPQVCRALCRLMFPSFALRLNPKISKIEMIKVDSVMGYFSSQIQRFSLFDQKKTLAFVPRKPNFQNVVVCFPFSFQRPCAV